MIDVTDVNNINIGDEVILFGKSSEGAEIPIENIASIMGTINYESFVSLVREFRGYI